MENIWNMFKQRTLDLQHVFHNMMIQSINQSTHPRENMVFNEFEDQQLQQAMALSMGQNVQNVVNYRNDIFPPPLPPSPNDYIRENHHEIMDDDTPFEDRQEEEEELRRVLQESLEDAKEKGIVDKNEKIEVNNRNDLYEENLDDVGEVIMQIRKERNSQDQRKRLMREQEEAYQESLRQDNLKKQEEQRKIQEIQERERELEMKKEMEEAIILSKELSKKQKIEKVTMNVPIEPSKNEKDIVEIVVRLTDGTKVSRRFKIDNTLNQLHNWITSLSDQSRHIPDLFSISSSFPRKKFTDLQLTFKDAGLIGSVLLFIEEEDEEDN